jgi:hypothetical protein
MRPLARIVIWLFVALLGVQARAEAIAIIGVNTGSFAGPDNSPANGNGTIDDIFAAAATFWEAVILDPRTITIQYEWDNSGGLLGAYDGTTIHIPALNPWFVDATPLVNEEYTTLESHVGVVGGTTLNYSVGFSDGTGAAAGFDLLTVLIHEIGHALSFVNPNLFADYADGDVDVTAPRPLEGLQLPLIGVHLGTPPGYVGMNPVMFPTIGEGERRFISDADLLFVGQSGEWQQLDPNRFPSAPEPGAVCLLGLGAAALRLRSRRAAMTNSSPFRGSMRATTLIKQ